MSFGGPDRSVTTSPEPLVELEIVHNMGTLTHMSAERAIAPTDVIAVTGGVTDSPGRGTISCLTRTAGRGLLFSSWFSHLMEEGILRCAKTTNV